MSGWSFRLSLDRPAVGVARGGGEASLGREERGPHARLEQADGSGGDEDQEREEAKRPVVVSVVAAPGGRSEKEDAGVVVVCGPLPKLWQ